MSVIQMISRHKQNVAKMLDSRTFGIVFYEDSFAHHFTNRNG